jgi:chromate transporter
MTAPDAAPAASSDSPALDEARAAAPAESYGRLFWRFLHFGLLAWGGPVAQIAMIRRELVDEERWITPAHFERVFAVYQVLPGPEAHELCVYFGMRARGRIGGLLAGLGFMLPGFVLMFALSWAYVRFGAGAAVFATMFYGTQPAIAAAVVRAVHRIGAPVLRDRWAWAVAVAGALGQLAGAPFLLTLPTLGLAYVLGRRGRTAAAAGVVVFVVIGATVLLARDGLALVTGAEIAGRSAGADASASPSLAALFGSGLRTGLLTFGGAYTAIPFLQRDAAGAGGWMTADEFLDGLALGGILPAPLIIFGTFVGFVGGGPLGALALTVGIFLPAFAFTLVAHDPLERLVGRPGLHDFLQGVTAAVVGLIAVAAVVLVRAAIHDAWTLAIALAALVVLYRWHAKLAILVVVVGGAAAGWLVREALARG